LIVGDADGVVVLPDHLAAEILADATEHERQERFVAERVAAGQPIEGLYPINERWRPAYEAWLAADGCDNDPPIAGSLPQPSAPGEREEAPEETA
jgi:hypothetical protein